MTVNRLDQFANSTFLMHREGEIILSIRHRIGTYQFENKGGVATLPLVSIPGKLPKVIFVN